MSTRPSKPRTALVSCNWNEGSSRWKSLGSDSTTMVPIRRVITSTAFHHCQETLRSNRRRLFLKSDARVPLSASECCDGIEGIGIGLFNDKINGAHGKTLVPRKE